MSVVCPPLASCEKLLVDVLQRILSFVKLENPEGMLCSVAYRVAAKKSLRLECGAADSIGLIEKGREHDGILLREPQLAHGFMRQDGERPSLVIRKNSHPLRSEEHTSELQ